MDKRTSVFSLLNASKSMAVDILQTRLFYLANQLFQWQYTNAESNNIESIEAWWSYVFHFEKDYEYHMQSQKAKKGRRDPSWISIPSNSHVNQSQSASLFVRCIACKCFLPVSCRERQCANESMEPTRKPCPISSRSPASIMFLRCPRRRFPRRLVSTGSPLKYISWVTSLSVFCCPNGSTWLQKRIKIKNRRVCVMMKSLSWKCKLHE